MENHQKNSCGNILVSKFFYSFIKSRNKEKINLFSRKRNQTQAQSSSQKDGTEKNTDSSNQVVESRCSSQVYHQPFGCFSQTQDGSKKNTELSQINDLQSKKIAQHFVLPENLTKGNNQICVCGEKCQTEENSPQA